jgi:hypothetical protein
MNTPPISRKRSYVSTPDNQPPIVSTPPTVIVPYHTPPTVILDEPRKSSIFDGPGQNLSAEFDYDAAKDVYLKRKIEYAKEYLDNQMKRHKAEQDARVEETKEMIFTLPKKNGGRRSKKAQRKHRKKTSKRKSRK